MIRFNVKSLRLPVLAIVAVLLAACGGGGGSTATVDSVTITGAPSSGEVAVGETVDLGVSVDVSGGASTDVSWSSSDSDVATVNDDGLVTGKSAGSVTITATSTADSSKSDKVNINVVADGGGSGGDTSPVTAVVVTPETAQIAVGDTVDLGATVEGDPGVSQVVTWSSSDSSIATVSGSGVVTGKAGGTVTITATSDVDGSKSDSAEVTIIACQAPKELTDITSPTTLNGIQGCTDYVAGNVTVSAALTINEGVKIVFRQDARLTVSGSGTIVANGTASEPVVFTGEQPVAGFWDGIEIATFANNELNFVDVSYGGSGGYANVFVQDTGRVALSNSSFNNSSTVGVYAQNGSQLPGFASNTFSGNAQGALTIAPDLMGSLDSASNYSGNGEDYINVFGGSVTTDQTWPDTGGVPFRMSNITIDAAVTVAPGADLVFQQDARLTVLGSLKAVGTAEERITFKGEQGAQGYWDGIEIASLNTDNVLDFVEVSDGGSANYASVFVQDTGSVTLSNSSFNNSSTVGVWAQHGSQLPGFANNSFSGNVQGALRIPPELIGSLDSASDYSGNTKNYIDVMGGTVITDQTWPDTGGVPFRLSNTTVDAAVTVAAGADFIFLQNARLTVEGSFNAVGTSSEPITFKGENAAQGYWDGIEISSVSSDNVLDFVEISDGGSGGWANVFVQDDGSVTLTHSTITNSSTYGLVVQSGGQTTPDTLAEMLSQNAFDNNASGAVDGL